MTTTNSEIITLHYRLDRAAGLAAGRILPSDEGSMELTPALLAALSADERAFLALHLSDTPRGAYVDLAGGIGTSRDLYPAQDNIVEPADAPALVAALYAAYCATNARMADERAADAAQRAALQAAEERERAVLAQALTAPVACVIGFLSEDALYGTQAAKAVAREGIRAWLASASADLATYWDRHCYEVGPVSDAITGVERHVVNLRLDRKAQRKQWVTDMVTFWGQPVDRARQAAGVLPRADLEALVWAAVQAPADPDNRHNCPRCGSSEAEVDEQEGKPVPAAAWTAADALSSAFQGDVLEALGLCLTRDIVMVTYDCPACEPTFRRELRVKMTHPENGWTSSLRYYPLEEV
jgi:hypothetical protein